MSITSMFRGIISKNNGLILNSDQSTFLTQKEMFLTAVFFLLLKAPFLLACIFFVQTASNYDRFLEQRTA